MPLNSANYQSALNDFNQARVKATLQEVLARVTGKNDELLSYEEVARKLKIHARADRGYQQVPVAAIIGSVGRYSDFTRGFLPRRESDRERWARVKAAMTDPAGPGLPPIEVYKVGEAYFVLDGNHRVSVARQEGMPTIEAHVIEIRTEIPVTAELDPDGLIIKAEYAEFLEQTGIKDLRPAADLSVTAPGQYHRLLEHIEVHRYFMGLEQQREIPYAEAVWHWYDAVYLPFIEPVRERDLLRWFPGRTETDLYLWVSEHRAALEAELAWSVGPGAAIENLAVQANPKAVNESGQTGAWRKAKRFDRYTGRLFADVLVPVSGEEQGWTALEQAILIAGRESAALHGLYVVPTPDERSSRRAAEVTARFERRCQEAGVHGRLAVQAGAIPEQVCSFARLADLVVLKTAHPPGAGLPGLGSGLRTILRRSTRPVLSVPHGASEARRALVAFDGGLKSREALFLAAYLAERWGTALTVLTVLEPPWVTEDVQAYARSYLEFHELQAEFLVRAGAVEQILEVSAAQETDLIVMGGYGASLVQEVVVGSAVNLALRGADCPVLVCR